AFKASVATGCLQTVMIEPKMLTQSVKALSDQREQVADDKQKRGCPLGGGHDSSKKTPCRGARCILNKFQ
ncbi:hypothetical protein, partial [Fibrobacter sp.]|uniref:hypothetical protein n=1 Tax=Fibrobacter sp. TaxID=35828 RepID=UPI0038647AD9